MEIFSWSASKILHSPCDWNHSQAVRHLCGERVGILVLGEENIDSENNLLKLVEVLCGVLSEQINKEWLSWEEGDIRGLTGNEKKYNKD